MEKNAETCKTAMRKMLYMCRLHRNIVERSVSDLGIHQSQHHVLMYIATEGEVTSQKQIAEKFGVTPAAIARSLKSLESEGFIVRKSTVDDGRFNRITITKKGKDIVERSRKMFKEADEMAFAEFSESDMNEFNRYLDMMQSRLKPENEID